MAPSLDRVPGLSIKLLTGLVSVSTFLLGLSLASSAEAAVGAFSRTGDMTVVRSSPRAAPLPDGRVFVVGGRQTVADVYDPATGTFTDLDTPTTDRYAPAVAALPDGKVLIAGGEVDYEASASAEIYDPSNDSYTSIASMPHPLIGAGAAPLPDGRIMLVGGHLTVYGEGTTTSLIFDPASNTFSPGNSPRYRRTFAALAALPDGRVVVVGGQEPPEVFDPATGLFHAGRVSLERTGLAPAVAALPDGTVLIIHSEDRMASIYDPNLDRLIPAAQMEGSRLNAMAITLPNEDVLVAGGWNGEADTRTAEIYSGGPYLVVSREPLAKALVGGAPVSGTINVTNVSAKPTHPLSPVTVSAGGSGVRLTSDGCGGIRLGPGESCALSIRFAPRKPGTSRFTMEATEVATRSFAVAAARITLKKAARVPRGKRPVLARIVCENGPCALRKVRATLRSGRKPVRLRVRTRKMIRGSGRVVLPIRAKLRRAGKVKIRIRAGIPGAAPISRQVTVRVRR